jgi:hypothetical protein
MDLPPPRSGLLRHWDTLIGPGASRAEQALILGAAVAGTIGVAAYAYLRNVDWTIWQWMILVVLALDLFGGVVANGTGAARRWYHRPGQTRRDHFLFVAVHLAQLVVFALAFPSANWLTVIGAYAYLLLSALAILAAPTELQRPVSYLSYIGALGVALLFNAPTGLEWFLPILYFKLLVSHLGMGS